jgi:hypothetical protein
MSDERWAIVLAGGEGTSRPANLAVLRVSGVVWNDLGEPRRVMATLARAGIEPEGVRATVLA